MKIFVKVKLKAREEKVKKAEATLFDNQENHFEVFVKEPPLEGRANKRVVELLAEYFKIPQSQIKIIQGFKSKEKVLEIIS
ncbi:MAG: DUF167 domain-containing protein [Candidatus Daviesbacteria bacterium]|nr:DUF167 domain-containing protein [Candidatus Daviesbacteria bacterium]